MDSKTNKLDKEDSEHVDTSEGSGDLKKRDVEVNALEMDMDHHIFVGGITQSGKSYFIKHLFDEVKPKNRRCIFFDYKNDPDHVKWIKKGHYPIFTTISAIQRYWNPKINFFTKFFSKGAEIKKKVIFRPPRPKGFGGAFNLLNDLADFVFVRGNTILFIDEIAPLTTPQKIPPNLYDCLVMGAARGVTIISVSQRPKDIHNVILSESYTKIFFRLNLEDDRKKVKGIANQEVADALHNLPNTYFIYVRADGYHQMCRLKDKRKNDKKIKNKEKLRTKG